MATWQSGQHREADKNGYSTRMLLFSSPLAHVVSDQRLSPFYLELLDIDVSRSIGVKQLKGLPDLLPLLLSQLWFGA